jgi:putative tryptophan/tyrosine transport system substrate-binding protein
MLTRRNFLIAMTLGISVPAAHAESKKKVMRVGVVERSPAFLNDGRWAEFDQEIRERGWIEGENIAFERRHYRGDRSQLPGIMAELLALDVDVIVVVGAFAALEAQKATSRIPIVFIVGDAVGRGIVVNLARPEGNATGVSGRFVDGQAKKLEMLKQLSPGISRVAALINTDLGYPPTLFQPPNKPPGMEVILVKLRGPDDLAPAFATIRKVRADAVLVVQGLDGQADVDLVDGITKLRLPALFPNREYVKRGALICFSGHPTYNLRRTAVYVDKILRGAKPGDLPVEQPTKYDLAINVKTARDLGITIPPELLVRADLIIE